MLQSIHPKLPMRHKLETRRYYTEQLGFKDIGKQDYPGYLILKKDQIELHFFEHNTLNVLENYGQVYIKTVDIEQFYNDLKNRGVEIHPQGSLQTKPWGLKEFSLLDPDHNLLTFGAEVAE
ncbi:VOC family protein [bacterium]|nr:VOC family protein [bacterium]